MVRSKARYGDDFGQDVYGVRRRLPQFLKENLPQVIFPGRWVLTVDVDEFLILPPAFADIVEFIARLDARDQPYATAPMIDFYGERLNDRNYGSDLTPFGANPYFDAGPYYVWDNTLSPYRLSGGLRFRLLRMLWAARPELIPAIYGDHTPAPAACWKVPLLKHDAGVTRMGDHEISVAPRSDLACALAHFKFYPGLDDKIEHALVAGQYYNRSMEYSFLKAAIEVMGDVSLTTWETRRFEGPHSLERAALLHGH